MANSPFQHSFLLLNPTCTTHSSGILTVMWFLLGVQGWQCCGGYCTGTWVNWSGLRPLSVSDDGRWTDSDALTDRSADGARMLHWLVALRWAHVPPVFLTSAVPVRQFFRPAWRQASVLCLDFSLLLWLTPEGSGTCLPPSLPFKGCVHCKPALKK